MAKRVLHIENDQRIVVNLRDCLQYELAKRRDGLDINLESAGSIEEALALVREGPPYDGLILDLMLPRSQSDLAQHAELEATRSKLVRELFESANQGAAEIDLRGAALRAEIDGLDERIRAVIEPDGGLEILAELRARQRDLSGELQPLALPVIILTARNIHAVQRQCQGLVIDELCYQFEKPVDDAQVVACLVGFLA